ncbi:MAG: extracellular solute-binding protein [Deltaproteobacteria bacterium]|nr:extracellular solute-binding protein [Deltaproteobacteria bacterium]
MGYILDELIRVVYYGALLLQDGKLILDGFKRAYPFIDYNQFRISNARLVSKVDAESKAGANQADLLNTSGLFPYQLVKQNLVARYSSPQEAKLRAGFADTNGYWAALLHIPVVLAYNTKLVKASEVPQKYEDLLDAKWRGRTVLDSDDEDLFAALVEAWGEAKGKNFLRGLGRNQASLRRGRVLIGQLLAAGEFSVAMFLHSEIPMRLKTQGAPVDLVYLPPFLSKLSAISIAKYAPRPYSAILLYDYLLSKDAQTIIADQLRREPVRTDVEGKHPEFTKEKYLVVNPHTAGPKLAEFENLFEEVFKVK